MQLAIILRFDEAHDSKDRASPSVEDRAGRPLELDLQLGLRVFLCSATDGEPIMLTLSADSTHGVLGKLFCDLASSRVGARER